MGFYDEMREVADDLLTEFQQGTILLRRTTGGAAQYPGDPITGGTVTDYTLKAAAQGVSQKYIDGTAVLATDVEVISAVPDVVPSKETDIIVVDGQEMTILMIEPIPAAGTKAAYVFIVRG